jgi:hypothetical protein
MPSKSKKSTGVRTRSGTHVYRRVRDPVLVDATSSTTQPYYIVSTASGGGTTYLPLAPLGVAGMSWVAGAASSAATATIVEPPRLPWLLQTSRTFQEYRVLNATLVFVSSLGSIASGSVTLNSSTDYADDRATSTSPTVIASTGGKTFSLASLANKEGRVPMAIDSSWKKVTNVTLYLPLGGSGLVASSTVNDLSFGQVSASLAGASASGTPASGVQCGMLYIEYDVEFRKPTSSFTNA